MTVASAARTDKVEEITFRVVATNQFGDLLGRARFPFHISLQAIGPYRLLIDCPSQSHSFFRLLLVNMPAMIRASRRA